MSEGKLYKKMWDLFWRKKTKTDGLGHIAVTKILDEAKQELAKVIPEPNEDDYELTIPYERTHLEEDRERYECFKKWFGDVVKTPILSFFMQLTRYNGKRVSLWMKKSSKKLKIFR